MDIKKGILIGIGILACLDAWADTGDRVEERFDDRGDRIEERLDDRRD